MHLFSPQVNDWNDWGKIFQSIPAFSPLIEHIFALHGLPMVEIENTKPGTNAVFKVGGYVIKIFAPPCFGQDFGTNIDVELFGMRWAQACDVPAPRVVASGLVEDTFAFHYIIMDWIEGKLLSDIEDELTYEDKITIGQKIRSITDKLNQPCDNFTPVDVMEYALRDKEWADEGYTAAFQAERLEYLHGFNMAAYQKVYCHSDFHAENILIDDKLDVYLIDFADAMYAPKEYEQVYIVSALFCFEKPYMLGYFGDYTVDEIMDLCMTWLPIHVWGHSTLCCHLKPVTELDSFETMRNRMRGIIEREFQEINKYTVTYMYGESGIGPDVELRFNWLTDVAADTYLVCERADSFEANGRAFSSNANHVAAECFELQNNVPIINDEIRKYINTATHYAHKAAVTLHADGAYFYAIGNGAHCSPPVRINTRAACPASFSFLWIADPQQDKYASGTPYVNWEGDIASVGSSNFKENLEMALAHAYAPEQAHLYANGKPDFAICTGDHCEHIYDKDGMDGFFRAGRVMLASTPYFPALGNHDLMGAPGHTGTWDAPDPFAMLYKGRFNPPKNGAAYTGGIPSDAAYSAATGDVQDAPCSAATSDTQVDPNTGDVQSPAATGDAARVLDGVNYFFTHGNALFMVLQGNSWTTAAYALDEQIAWMRHVVTTHGQGKWKIIYKHHGIYTASYNSVEGYEKLSAFFDECGIDLVLNGHNHVYARSKPIRGFLPAERGAGTVHITGGTVSGNCAWGGYVYKPERRVPEETGLPMTELMDFLSLTDGVDAMNKNIYHVITVDERGISITAMRAHDGSIVKHNARQPGDVTEENGTVITDTKPLSERYRAQRDHSEHTYSENKLSKQNFSTCTK
ncbi:MAG: phosphotransferase [Defluviitaleaceae bacterium]|nr:phosphotransferase [Defluviitaleaceae bacterium]